jgi:hypothetical protein
VFIVRRVVDELALKFQPIKNIGIPGEDIIVKVIDIGEY